MKTGLNQTTTWAIAVLLSIAFFGITIAMLFKIAEREKQEHLKGIYSDREQFKSGHDQVIAPSDIDKDKDGARDHQELAPDRPEEDGAIKQKDDHTSTQQSGHSQTNLAHAEIKKKALGGMKG